MNRKLKSFLFEIFAWLGAPLVAVILYGYLATNTLGPQSDLMATISVEYVMDKDEQSVVTANQYNTELENS